MYFLSEIISLNRMVAGIEIGLTAQIKLECLKISQKALPRDIDEKEMFDFAKQLSNWVFDPTQDAFQYTLPNNVNVSASK